MWKVFSWYCFLKKKSAFCIQYEPFTINIIKEHCHVWILMHPQRVLKSAVMFWSSPTLIWQWECPRALVKQWPLFRFINRDQCLISVPPTSTKSHTSKGLGTERQSAREEGVSELVRVKKRTTRSCLFQFRESRWEVIFYSSWGSTSHLLAQMPNEYGSRAVLSPH